MAANDPVDPNATDTSTSAFDKFMAEQGAGLDFTSSTGKFGATFPYQKRIVVGISDKLDSQQQAALSSQIGKYPGTSAMNYSGEYLVDQNRLIVRQPYDLSSTGTDVYDELYSLKDGERFGILSLLQSRGFYGGGKASPGVPVAKDRTAWKEFLGYANSKGYTWRSLLGDLAAAPAVYSGGGSGTRVKATSSEDIGAYIKQASLDKLGRTMTKDDVDTAIAAIQKQQIDRASSKMDAPSLSVAAEQQVSKLQGNAEKGVQFRKAIDAAMSIVS
jgi:hypothetical protein